MNNNSNAGSKHNSFIPYISKSKSGGPKSSSPPRDNQVDPAPEPINLSQLHPGVPLSET